MGSTTSHQKLTTQDAVERIPLSPTGKPVATLDTELKGFMVVATKNVKSYYVQRDIKGQSVRVFIGRAFDGKDKTQVIKLRDARQQALAIISRINEGWDPRKPKPVPVAEHQGDAPRYTLREAVELHLSRPDRPLRPKTANEYRNIFNVYVKDWLDVPVTDLAARHEEFQALHVKITREGFDTSAMQGKRGYRPQKQKGSPYAANGMVRALRAVYNTARTDWPKLRLAPLDRIRLNKEKAKDKAVETKQLPDWYAKVTAFRAVEPIKADAILLAIFTGMRLGDIKRLRWDDVILNEQGEERLFAGEPKGGARKAYWIPLSDFAIQLLQQRHACEWTRDRHANSPYVFPGLQGEHTDLTTNRKGFEMLAGRKSGFSAHDYRHSYATYASNIGVTERQIEQLMNQAQKTVNAKYAKREIDALRPAQQDITDYICKHAKITKSSAVGKEDAKG